MRNLRYLIFFPLFAAGAGIYGLTLAAGAGGLLGYTFTRYTMEGEGLESTQKMDRADYGGFLFFDTRYAEFSMLIQGGKNNYEETMFTTDTSLTNKDKGTGSEVSLGFSLAGKYPFFVSEKISWFPLLGIDYQIALKQRRKPEGQPEYDRSKGQGISSADVDKNGNNYPLGAWNALWIKVGGGLDYHFSGAFFLRSELLFGFRLQTGYETGAFEVVEDLLHVTDPKLAGLTGNPSLKIGIGYQF